MQTAQVLIVGNEILSGRTQDTNSRFLARSLDRRGVRLTRGFIVPDDIEAIVEVVRSNRHQSDYFFVSGGIGGTPDDKTRLAMAQAMGVPLRRHPVAERILREYYGDRINEERLSMADLPEGCALIDNPITRAPGFRMGTVFVFAGIPRLFEAMFAEIQGEFKGRPLFEKEISLAVGEGDISRHLSLIDGKYPEVELGSYPKLRDGAAEGRPLTELVLRAADAGELERAYTELFELVKDHLFQP